jgi:DNA-binding NtrC family response regulator
LVVELPSLRERREDIRLLLGHFVSLAQNELGREVAISAEAMQAAMDHPWPGNVRALKNAVYRAAALAEGPISAKGLVPPGLVPMVGPQHDCDKMQIPRGDYAQMRRALLSQVVVEQGSIRRAARVLGIPRTTLATWLRLQPSS